VTISIEKKGWLLCGRSSIFMIEALAVGGVLCGFNYKNEHPTELQKLIKCATAQ